MSERCYKCFRPLSHCLCSYATPVDCGIKFVLLMHPKEAKRERTGTGHLAHITLTGSEILVGLDFSQNARLQELLCDRQFLPVLLYPGNDTWTAGSAELATALGKNTQHARTLLVLVIDATWFCSRKVIEHSPFLLDLPRISFSGSYRSEFTFKREPRSEYISTIESCYYLIKELQAAALVPRNINALPLMTVFRKMVAAQIQAQNDRIDGKLPNTHAYNWKYTKKFGEP
ncbi:MAG: DTW domain-containing protein [Treponema sp.]|nr:DTW domain-containing protein [Treponema sp.]